MPRSADPRRRPLGRSEAVFFYKKKNRYDNCGFCGGDNSMCSTHYILNFELDKLYTIWNTGDFYQSGLAGQSGPWPHGQQAGLVLGPTASRPV